MPEAKDNGLLLEAKPKVSTSRQDMQAKLDIQAREMDAKAPVRFSQLPTPSVKAPAPKPQVASH